LGAELHAPLRGVTDACCVPTSLPALIDMSSAVATCPWAPLLATRAPSLDRNSRHILGWSTNW
ncbi:MAG: hypothetical protein AB7K24_34960, partial [Gemmataceae bacterium]